MRKLKQSEVPMVREKLAAKQLYKCPLCGASLKQKGAVLDHCHTTGAVRAVLCRNCNGIEGRIKTSATRAATRKGMIDWLENLAVYWRHYDTNVSTMLYPSHKNEDEKRLERNLKARKRRAATKV